ncbi:Uncharacterised protein [Enterobacter cloacae]|nr:Uncharacterised protein [Enterobacter cloacae]
MAQTPLIKMGVVNKSPVFRGSKGERRGARARGNTHMPDTMTGQGFKDHRRPASVKRTY